MLLAGSVANAQTESQVLTWTEPTFNTDGTPLTDLENYEIFWDCVDSGPPYASSIVIPAPQTTYTVLGLPDIGFCYFAATAINAEGVSSDYSGEATHGYGPTIPNSILNLDVIGGQDIPPYIYSLPTTDFSNNHVVAGNWSVPGQSLDINFTINPRTLNCDCRIISKATSTAEAGHYFMVSTTGAGNNIRFRLKTNGTTTTLIGSSIPLNQETTGRAVYNGTQMQIYLNGSLDVSTNKTGDMNASTTEVWVGANPPDASGQWDGTIAVTVN